jgi:hypothetical protein
LDQGVTIPLEHAKCLPRQIALMEETMNFNETNHQEIVKNLLNNKAVDFAAIGKTVAEIGPTRAMALEPWEEFCGTMRHFVRLYRLGPQGPRLENLEELGQVAGDLRK